VVASPAIDVPADLRREWPRDEAVKIAVRGRLEASGPVLGAAVAKDLALPMGDVRDALLALEADGFAMRGQFTQESGAPIAVSSTAPRDEESLEWCERRLLSRIHRLTLDGLRRQIQAVPPAAFMRFLARFQHADPATRLRGEAGLHELIAQFEGFEAPAADWERHIFASRMERYEPAWLDALSYSGRAMWCRLRPRRSAPGAGRPMKAVTRALPITILEREDLGWLLPKDSVVGSAGGASDGPTSNRGAAGAAGVSARATAPVSEGETGRPLGANARAVLDALEKRGALFGAELAAEVSLLPRQLEDALGELVAAGLVTSDGYAALRALAGAHAPDPHRRGVASSARLLRRRFGRSSTSSRGLASGGRWSLLRRAALSAALSDPAQRIDEWCELLLRRYGVVFRDLLAREPAAPAWGALVRAYRRMEARGEVRGGRFVSDVAGEQYALPEAIAQLRAAADSEESMRTARGSTAPAASGVPAFSVARGPSIGAESFAANAGIAPASDLLVIAATDPLNLFGRVVPGQKVPALTGHRLAIKRGELMAFARGRDVHVVADAARSDDRAELTRVLGRAS
jgi:ATP-dependent Lhr-like helicase